MGEDEEHRCVLATGAGPDVHGSDAGEAPAGAGASGGANLFDGVSNVHAVKRGGAPAGGEVLNQHHSYERFATSGGRGTQ